MKNLASLIILLIIGFTGLSPPRPNIFKLFDQDKEVYETLVLLCQPGTRLYYFYDRDDKQCLQETNSDSFYREWILNHRQ